MTGMDRTLSLPARPLLPRETERTGTLEAPARPLLRVCYCSALFATLHNQCNAMLLANVERVKGERQNFFCENLTTHPVVGIRLA